MTAETNEQLFDKVFQKHFPNGTNAERLEGLKWVSSARPLTREEAYWLIQQAERAQELDKALSDENELYNKMYDKAVELDRENARLREALEQVKENLVPLRGLNSQHDSCITDICINIYQALKGESA